MNRANSVKAFAAALLRLQADPDFLHLDRELTGTNAFRVLGTTFTERWHTAFWAWVLNLDASHGLGDFAIRRLLTLCAQASGRLPAVHLITNTDTGRPVWRRGPAPYGQRSAIDVVDLADWRIEHAVVAPSELTDGAEIGPRTAAKGRRSASDRFDVLLAMQGRDPAATGQAPMSLLVVLEFKVNAPYDAQQLQRYGKWLFDAPSARTLQDGQGRQSFVDALNTLYGRQRRAEGGLFALGVFVAKTLVEGGDQPLPRELDPAWASLTYSDLIREVLEPMLQATGLDTSSVDFIRSYIAMAAHPDSNVLKGISEAHRKLAERVVERHRDTFLVIARALMDSSEDSDAETGQAIHASLTVRPRGKSLTVSTLLELGLATLGNRLRHDPLTPQGCEGPPFAGSVIVRIEAEGRFAFALESVAGEPVEDFDGRYSATGLLKKLYERYHAKFPANGNSYLTFVDGRSAGLRLADVYDRLRAGDGRGT